MIGKLTGRLDQVSLNAVIVDVGGVGYEVTVGARTLSMLPPVGRDRDARHRHACARGRDQALRLRHRA